VRNRLRRRLIHPGIINVEVDARFVY